MKEWVCKKASYVTEGIAEEYLRRAKLKKWDRNSAYSKPFATYFCDKCSKWHLKTRKRICRYSGKIRYHTEQYATYITTKDPLNMKAVYRCRDCGGWHTTGMTKKQYQKVHAAVVDQERNLEALKWDIILYNAKHL